MPLYPEGPQTQPQPTKPRPTWPRPANHGRSVDPTQRRGRHPAARTAGRAGFSAGRLLLVDTRHRLPT